MKQQVENSGILRNKPFSQFGDYEQSVLEWQMVAIHSGRSKLLVLRRIRLTTLQEDALFKFLFNEGVCNLEEIDLSYCDLSLNESYVFELFFNILTVNKNLTRLNLLGHEFVEDVKNKLLSFANNRRVTLLLDGEMHPIRTLVDGIPNNFGRDGVRARLCAERLGGSVWSGFNVQGIANSFDAAFGNGKSFFQIDLSRTNFGARPHEYYSPGDEGSPGGYVSMPLRFKFTDNLKLYRVMCHSANLFQSVFQNISIVECCFNYSDFSNSGIINSEFSRCEMIGVKFGGRAGIMDSRFHLCDMRSAGLMQASFMRCDLRDANLAYADLNSAIFSECDLRHIDLRKVKNISSARFLNCNMSGVDLTHCDNIGSGNFSGSILFGATLPTVVHLIYHALNYPRASQQYQNILIKAEKSSVGIFALELAELKYLYLVASKNKKSKSYMQAIGPLVKEVNRQKVYSIYFLRLLNNSNLPERPIKLISQYPRAPEKTFLTHSKFKIRYGGGIFAQLKEIPLSLVMIKPAGLVYFREIVADLLENGFVIVAMKSHSLTAPQIQKLYHSLQKTYFFNSLQKYLLSSKVFILAVSGDAHVLTQWKLNLRAKIGSRVVDDFRRLVLEKGVVLKDDHGYDIDGEVKKGLDVLHCSDYGVGNKELGLFFTENELKLIKPDLKLYFKCVQSLLKSKKPERLGLLALPNPNNPNQQLTTEWLMLVKPAGINHLQRIVKAIRDGNIHIIGAKFVSLSTAQVKRLYAKYRKAYYYDALVKYLVKHTSIALVLQGQYDKGVECRLHLREILNEARTVEARAVLQRYDEKNKIGHDEHLTSRWIAEYILMFDIVHTSEYADRKSEIELIFDKTELVDLQCSQFDRLDHIQSLLLSYQSHMSLGSKSGVGSI